MTESRIGTTEEHKSLADEILSRFGFTRQHHKQVAEGMQRLGIPAPSDYGQGVSYEEMALQLGFYEAGQQLQDNVNYFNLKVVAFLRKWQGRRCEWTAAPTSEEFVEDSICVALAAACLAARFQRERDSAGIDELKVFGTRLQMPDLDGCIRDWPALSMLLTRVASGDAADTKRTRRVWSPKILSQLRQNQRILADMMNESEDGEVSIEDLASRCGFDSPDDNTNGLVRRFNAKLGSLGDPRRIHRHDGRIRVRGAV